MATRDVFSEVELAGLRGFPPVIGRDELIRHFTLSQADAAFVRRFRGSGNVLGAAVQLCTLPWLGFVPDDVASAPGEAVSRLAGQLGVPCDGLAGYGLRGQTRTDHLREVAAFLGWRSLGPGEAGEFDEFLLARALEHDSPKLLFGLGCEYLVSARVIRPGVVLVLERVATARDRARAETWARVEHLLPEKRREQLDAMLVVDPVVGRSRLSLLGEGPTQANPAAVKAELAKLTFLRSLGADQLDLSMLPGQRLRFLAGLGRRLTAQALTRREPARRYPILLAVLSAAAVDVLDESVLLFDQAVSGRESAARSRMTEALAQRGRGGEDRQVLLDEILAVVLDPQIADEQVGGLLRERIGLPRLREAAAAGLERLPRDHGHLALLDSSIGYLRQFAPDVLGSVRFAGGPGSGELLAAVTVLASLYATGARKVPPDAPTGFVPARWAGYLADAGEAGDATGFRHYWELCVLLGLRDG